jgi:hypothetical protein
MKFYHLPILPLLILSYACSNSTDSSDAPNFEDINIKYYKSGGWINAFSLTIDSSGFVKVFVNSHSSLDLIDSNTTIITKEEKQKLSSLFSSFEDFKNYYEPEYYYTDQNYHTIILRNRIKSDTTSVYDPPHCNLPNDLKQIISFMEEKIDELLE